MTQCSAVGWLPVGSKNLSLPFISRDGCVSDGNWRLRWLRLATALLLDGQGHGLGEARVGHLVIQQVHDRVEVLGLDILPVDGLHDPAALHACGKALALRVSWVPRLADDLLHHGSLAAVARGVAQDAERTLLEAHVHSVAGGRGGVERKVSIPGALPLLVFRTNPGHHTAAAEPARGGADEALAREEAEHCPSQAQRQDRAALSDSHLAEGGETRKG
mmetsp:Transcript_78185/g.141095  ORF Transcript_78185/g.141095 Transcript_78185/m.141095 type:complete len:218 (-) Transcript_78185:31-684(-)